MTVIHSSSIEEFEEFVGLTIRITAEVLIPVKEMVSGGQTGHRKYYLGTENEEAKAKRELI